MSVDERPASRRPLLLLVLGMATGVLLAAAGLTRPARSSPPRDVVALVNGVPIRRNDYDRLLEALAADRRDPLDDEDRRHVLDRLIDEELLVQRGLELGLARRERRLRADLTGAVIASVVAAAEDGSPDEADLRAFYDHNADFFRRLGRVHVRQVFVRADGADSDAALQRAREAVQRLKNGAEYDTVAAALGDAPLPPLPDVAIPVPKLRDYLGPTAARTALELAPGEISEPIRSSDGFHVLELVGRQENTTPPYEEIRAQVAAEFRRRQGEAALRRYLDDLRDRSEITIAEDAP